MFAAGADTAVLEWFWSRSRSQSGPGPGPGPVQVRFGPGPSLGLVQVRYWFWSRFWFRSGSAPSPGLVQVPVLVRLSCSRQFSPQTPARPQLVRFWSPARFLCSPVPSLQDAAAVHATETRSRYKDAPWTYLESSEYLERYGSDPVWTGYRRNHKGGIPPQKTRRTCIRGDKVCGNPCPVCRDQNLVIHPQNVKLLQQFISPHTGSVYDPTLTGVCMKQQKNLNSAINAARDHGFLPFQIPHVQFSKEDYSNSHDAVGRTPPPPSLQSGAPWYYWYGALTPDEGEVSRVRRRYKAYLK